MKIIKVSKARNDYIVTLENNEQLMVDQDTLVKYRLLTDTTLDSKTLQKLKLIAKNYEAYQKTLKYTSKRLRSVKETREFIKKLEGDVDHITDQLIKYGYLNDDRFAQTYIHDRVLLSSDGPNKIIDELKNQAIITTVIDQYMGEYNNDFWQDRILNQALKKIKTLTKGSSYLIKNKLSSYLYTLGYSKEMIDFVLKEINIDNEALLKKNIDKLKNKYEREVIISKLQKYGFNYYEIINQLDNE